MNTIIFNSFYKVKKKLPKDVILRFKKKNTEICTVKLKMLDSNIVDPKIQ